MNPKDQKMKILIIKKELLPISKETIKKISKGQHRGKGFKVLEMSDKAYEKPRY